MRPVKLPGKAALTAEVLRQYLAYDKDTGVFTRLIQTTPAIKVGDVAGTLARSGYIQIQVAGSLNYAHRLAWLHSTGAWPKNDIDHIDGNRSNNTLANLRDVPRRTNLENRRHAQKRNKSGLLGAHVSFGKYAARICSNGKTEVIGRFDSAEEAHSAYVHTKRQLHSGCTI